MGWLGGIVDARPSTDSLAVWFKRPSGVAATYFLFGVSWIIVSDTLVLLLVENERTATFVQTVKGWAFVGGSTVLIFALVWYATNAIQRSNDQLDRALQQTSIFHRLLRHNLRNNCNVIHGHAAMLETAVADDEAGRLRIIQEQAITLTELSEKTQFLRDIVLEGPAGGRRVDLAAQLRSVIQSIQRRHRAAEVDVDIQSSLRYETDERLKRGIAELLENGIVHNDRAEPTVRVSARADSDGGAEVVIRDDGPGLPEIERDVLERGLETPMFHSEGIGLWIARTVVDLVGGEISIDDNEPPGTVVRIQLP